MTAAFNLANFANKINSSGQIDLATSTTGTLPVGSLPLVTASKGGTGLASLPLNNVLLGNTTNPVQTVAPGATDNVLASNGTTWLSTPISNLVAFVRSLRSGSPISLRIPSTTGDISISLVQDIATTSTPQFARLGIGVAASSFDPGSLSVAGQIFANVSDEQLKDRIHTIDNALDKVSQLTGFIYKHNAKAQTYGLDDKEHAGLSAQEVEKVLPCAVAPAPIDAKYKTIQYDEVIPLLVEAIKELRLEVKALQNK